MFANICKVIFVNRASRVLNFETLKKPELHLTFMPQLIYAESNVEGVS